MRPFYDAVARGNVFIFMRGALLFGLLLLSATLWAQGGETPNLFMTERPDVSIVVQKPEGAGADTLTISVLKDGYPRELLQSQIEKLGELLKDRPTIASLGLHSPNPNAPRSGVLQAIVGIHGLIDRENSTLGLEKLAQAFAGVPEPNTIDTLNVQYESETPTTNTIQAWRDHNGLVLVQAQANPLVGIEYRIKLYTQDLAKIRIPEGKDAQDLKPPPVEKPKEQRSDWWIWPVVILAALALGALVYSLLLRPRPASRSR